MKQIIAALMLALVGFLSVAAGVLPAVAQSSEVEITADNFRVDDGENQAVFSGNVVITQPDLTVWADKVRVRYGDGGPSDLKDFEAIGNVKIKQPAQSARANRGIYNPETKILRLSGNVVVTNKSGKVSGPELIIDIAKGTSQFSSQSGGGRVTGIFSTE